MKQWYVLTADQDWNDGKASVIKGPFEYKEQALTHCYDNSCWVKEMTATEANNKVC